MAERALRLIRPRSRRRLGEAWADALTTSELDVTRAAAIAARQELRLADRIQAHALNRATPAFLDASF